MKATGIVRRIDDLGRVVIPKEIRRTMRIREGDPLEIYTDKEGGVIFKKYSLMGGVADFAAQLCDTLSRTTGQISVITDRDNCIAVAGVPRRELADHAVSQERGQRREGRQIYQRKPGERALPLCAEGDNTCSIPQHPSCVRGMCWDAWCLLDRATDPKGARWSINWPSPSPAFWDATWRVDENRPVPVWEQVCLL